MCRTPRAPDVTVESPEILRNPFLDDARSDTALVDSIRRGRSSLRIPLGSATDLFSSRGASASVGGTAGPRGNGRTPRVTPRTTIPVSPGNPNSPSVPGRPNPHGAPTQPR